MKIINIKLIVTVILLLMLLCCRESTNKRSQDIIELTIGNQIWMTDNLNVEEFRNGDPIKHIKSAKEWKKAGENGVPAWCYYDNDSNNDAVHGKLYNWHAINDPRGLAPDGWHIPTTDEWNILIEHLGGEKEAGGNLKDLIQATEIQTSNKQQKLKSLTSGFRSDKGSYNFGKIGSWWSANELGSSDAFFYFLNYDLDVMMRGYGEKSNGLSVRCIKD